MTDREPDQQDDPAAVTSGVSASADLGVRFVARLIDGVLLGIVYMVLIVPIIVVAVFSGASGLGGFGGFGAGAFVAGIVFAAVVVGYFALMEASRGQTVGKMVMKLKTQGPDGENPSLEMAIKRNAWYALGIIPVIGGLAELGVVIYIAVTISQSATNTGWHDTFAGGTRVVKTG